MLEVNLMNDVSIEPRILERADDWWWSIQHRPRSLPPPSSPPTASKWPPERWAQHLSRPSPESPKHCAKFGFHWRNSRLKSRWWIERVHLNLFNIRELNNVWYDDRARRGHGQLIPGPTIPRRAVEVTISYPLPKNFFFSFFLIWFLSQLHQDIYK